MQIGFVHFGFCFLIVFHSEILANIGNAGFGDWFLFCGLLRDSCRWVSFWDECFGKY